MKKNLLYILALSFLLIGCSHEEKKYPSHYQESPAVTINDIIFPQATGKNIIESEYVQIDYSNTSQGYIMAKLKKQSSHKIKIEISKDDFPYRYDLSEQTYTALPLQMNNGSYTIKILQNLEGNRYAVKKSQVIDVQLENDLMPYLYPNQLIWYEKGSPINQVAIETVKENTNDLERIKTIYEYVAHYLTYDDEKAVESTQRYILPNLEELLEEKRGICFDYASMMVAMLRINHIPARLICGDTDVEYHAWVEVYLEGEGWVNPDIFIDQKVWTRMDPTFASSKYKYDGDYKGIYYY